MSPHEPRMSPAWAQLEIPRELAPYRPGKKGPGPARACALLGGAWLQLSGLRTSQCCCILRPVRGKLPKDHHNHSLLLRLSLMTATITRAIDFCCDFSPFARRIPPMSPRVALFPLWQGEGGEPTAFVNAMKCNPRLSTR